MKITNVRPHTIALDGAATLEPGASAQVEETDRVRALVEAGALRTARNRETTTKKQSETKADAAADEKETNR